PRAASAPTSDPALDDDEDEFDPVQIAADAIGRLRQRARTDLAELRTHYQRHDLVVLVVAFVIIVAAGRLHQSLVVPPTVQFSVRGLTFERPKAWIQPEPMQLPAPRIVRELGAESAAPSSLYAVEFSSSIAHEDTRRKTTDQKPPPRLEVIIDTKPAWSNIVTGLDLDRRTRWGELYSLEDSSVSSIAGHDWLRTAYRYAHTVAKGDVPRVDRAIEYATIDREQIYVVTMFGTPAELDEIEQVITPTLRVPTQTGLPLVPQTRALTQRKYPNAVGSAFGATVMVVTADLVNGRLKARGGGSGVIVHGDGSILTNYHVIHDKDGRLHDVFVIGRFSEKNGAPQLWCAGRPSRAKYQRENDLALIKCDLDLDGRAWTPDAEGKWDTLAEARKADVEIGQTLWVLGYPDVGGGGLTLSQGEVRGWTGEDGAVGKDFIKTDASITRGNSGGPVIDDHGRLVGIASAFRTRATATGDVVEVSQVGLVRPLSTASCLMAIAAVGWTPREGLNDCEFQPSAVEAPSEGIQISTVVLDAANDQPVPHAMVMIMRPGVEESEIDVNRLDELVLAWGRSNTQGEVQLKQLVPAPGTYTVMVVAPGYEAHVEDGALHLEETSPPHFDPWGWIKLRSR
ncbi:MAG: S1C family serine protease, partial [Kofleriaceae bacterium]